MLDARGLWVTGADAESAQEVDAFVARLLRLDRGVEAVVPAAEAHPGVPMLQVYAAAANLYGQTTEGNAAAATLLDRAEARRAEMTGRERLWLAALREWQARAHDRSAQAFEALTEEWPEDLCAAKVCEFLYYIMGQQYCGARFRAHMDRLEGVNGGDPDFLGMTAFASELCGDLRAAEERSRRSIELEARNPWAHHALTHVLIRQGRAAEGAEILEDFLPVLATCGRPVYCHDAWHLALLYLEELDFDRARGVLDGHIWGFQPDTVGEQVDAIALLWRMEMAGCPMDDYWAEVARRVVPHATETFMPFLNAHFAYALARAGESQTLDGLLEAVAARAEARDDEAVRVWAPAGRAVVEAAAVFGSGDRGGAAAVLRDAVPVMTSIGGSDAQDDLFRQMFGVSLREAGRVGEAREFFAAANAGKRPTPLDAVLVGG